MPPQSPPRDEKRSLVAELKQRIADVDDSDDEAVIRNTPARNVSPRQSVFDVSNQQLDIYVDTIGQVLIAIVEVLRVIAAHTAQRSVIDPWIGNSLAYGGEACAFVRLFTVTPPP